MFLTGALGYIGTTINHALIERGFSVVGLDAGYFPNNCFYREDIWQSRERMDRLIRKDIRDTTAEDLGNCEAVVDFAGLANDPSADLSPNWTQEINHLASSKLAQLAKKKGVRRYVFSSSCSVYGARGDSLLNEDSDVEPVSEYAKAKLAAERDILPLADQAFFPTVLRNATAFGASPRMRFDLVINNLAGFGHTSGVVKVLSDGTAWRPNVHIEDIAHAVIACLESPSAEVSGQVFNVGMESQNYRVSELSAMVAETLGGCRVETATSASRDPRSYRVSFRRISNLRGFRPAWDVRRGIRELKTAFEKNHLTYESFQSPEYHNVRRLKQLITSGQLDETLRFRQ